MKKTAEKIFYSMPTPLAATLGSDIITSLGTGPYKKQCEKFLSDYLEGNKVLLTPSCSASLEMCALAVNLQPGDEVILPSFTFVTSASAFALRGARLVFVDIRPDTLNIDENLLEAAITNKTKAVVVVHYAGVAAEMDRIREICSNRNIAVIEDAAQGIGASYRGAPLGSIGDFGCFSFHHTKNIHAGGEGGALVVKNQLLSQRVEILQEKGTDRSKFIRGEIDKYTWQELSSSYVMSEIQGACLADQLQRMKQINALRMSLWESYFAELTGIEHAGLVTLPKIPVHCQHNAHIFFMLLPDADSREQFVAHMRAHNIEATTHYVPLHSSPAGKKYSTFCGKDVHTTDIATRIVRLPLYNTLSEQAQSRVIDTTFSYFKKYKARRSA